MNKGLETMCQKKSDGLIVCTLLEIFVGTEEHNEQSHSGWLVPRERFETDNPRKQRRNVTVVHNKHKGQ